MKLLRDHVMVILAKGKLDLEAQLWCETQE